MCRKLICLVLLLVVSGVTADTASGDIATGLVGYWPLDGDGADASGNGLDGTISGTVVPTSDRSGSPDSAMQFGGGQGDYVEIGDQPEFQLDEAITLSGWVMLDSSNTNNGRIVSKIGGKPAYSWSLNIEAKAGGVANPPAFMISLTGTEIVTVISPEPLPTDEWVHMAGVFRPGEALEVYVNGVLMARNTKDIPPSHFCDNGIPVRIGNYTTWNNCGWLGAIDEVRVYERSLSADDISELYAFSPLPRVTAWKPDPADGATIEATWVKLGWEPARTAVSHDVYIGVGFEDVNAGDGSTFQGNQAEDFVVVGFPGFPIPGGLVEGTTYYWRIDEVNDADPNSPWKGDVWSFSVPSKKAYDADPPDGAEYVGAEPTFTWADGFDADAHYVYFGDNADEVAAATGALPQAAATFTPGTLELGKTYYWRVDEFDGTDTHTGDVWSFSTIPIIEVTDPSLVGWWKFDEGRSNILVDWSGNNHHATVLGEPVWESGPAGFDGALNFKNTKGAKSDNFDPTGGTGKFTLTLWCRWDGTRNTQHFLTKSNGWGAETMMFQVEVKGGDSDPARADRLHLAYQGASQAVLSVIPKNEWAHVALTFDRTNATSYLNGVNDVLPQPTGIGPNIDAPVWIGVAHNDARVFQGLLDDVRLFNKVLTADEITMIMRGDLSAAWNPSPANESTTSIKAATSLTWSAGDGASGHDVYLGADQAVVETADATDTTGVYKGRQNGTSYNPGADVEWGGGPYYWRVDEVKADGTITPGRLWSFTVDGFLVVDDFEAYNDINPDEPGTNRIFMSWVDGFGITTNGSMVGNIDPPFAEMGVVHTGRQSMPYTYYNDLKTSEAAMTLTDQRDWTEHGITKLSLWFRGSVYNAPERMFVALNGNAVVYHDDAEVTKTGVWTEWVIELTRFANQGVNLANVNTITIGFGTKNNPAAGGTGQMYFDDIRLYR